MLEDDNNMDKDEMPPCEEHDHRISSLRALVDQTAKEVAVMQEILKRLDKSLFGNGQPGVIQDIRADAASTKRKVESHDKMIWIGTGAILLMQFLSSNGVVSLKGFIGH